MFRARFLLLPAWLMLTAPLARADQPDQAEAVRLILDQTNAFRTDEKRPKVTVNKELTRTAQEFARFMATTGKYGHTADDRQPAERARAAGYAYCIVLENIAYQYNSAGFTTAELGGGFVNGWKESPGHRKNMLDPDVTETGVAVARSAETGYYYAVQLFGRPKAAAIEFSVRNATDAEVTYQVGNDEFTLAPRYTRTHTVCRTPAVRFIGPKGVAAATTEKPLTPTGGTKLVVTGAKGDYHVGRE